MKRSQLRKRSSGPSPQQIARRNQIIGAHDWFGMATLRFQKGNYPNNEKKLVTVLCRQISDVLRYHGLRDVGFIVSRENGRKEGLHYHILFTSPTLSNFPEGFLDRLRALWLKRIGAKNNQGRPFQWDHLPTKEDQTRMADYIKKTHKGGFPVLRIPRAWSGIVLSPRQFHTRGLGHGGGRKCEKREEEVLCGGECSGHTSPTLSDPQSEIQTPSPLHRADTTNWSISLASSTDSPPGSFGTNSPATTIATFSVSLPLPPLTQNHPEVGSPPLTLSDSRSHTFSANNAPPLLTRSLPQAFCETCEYHGLLTPVIPSLSTCPLCHNLWGMCCPF